MNQICADPENGRAETDFTGMNQRMLLKLLISARTFAVAFGGIHYAPTRDTLRFGRKRENPCDPDDRREGQNAIEVFEHCESPRPSMMTCVLLQRQEVLSGANAFCTQSTCFATSQCCS